MAAIAVVLLAGCTTGPSGRPSASPTEGTSVGSGTTATSSGGPSRSASPVVSGTPTFALPAAPTCSTPRARPDPHRPRVALRFTLGADHRTVVGTETIVFRPDLPVSELVFRLSANSKETVDGGNRVTVTSASADHGGGPPTYSRANAAASTQGGLLHIPFAARVAAGTIVTAHLAFTVKLGKPYFDRFGRVGRYAYFGSAQPLLAWQRGYGWHTEDLSVLSSETTTSEAMDVDLTVRAPGADTVIASGDPADPPPSSSARTWHSHLDAARDVSVAAGPFVVADSVVGAVRLRVGADSAATAARLTQEYARAIQVLSAVLGPYPFPSLSVAYLPNYGGGIEYPSAVLMFKAEGDRYIDVHETAHQWFYAMVGNSQAAHPWLDEAFAQFYEELVDDEQPHTKDLSRPGRVDSSTESFGKNVQAFVTVVYAKGAAALRAARDTGSAAWDAAMRCYLAVNAWRIAVPSDVSSALAKLPHAVQILRRAGAVP